MAEIQKIDPETTAHKIATMLTEQYIKNIKNTLISSIEDNEICTIALKAAALYAISYDEIYDYFSTANEDT
ncbi:MAG: hypothetical protein K2N51_09620 [Lachnospiraceae bacterium]|nr:hypothetical protein [Lachnospiraceae bacterium]